MRRRGYFITFEGPEGSGKSSQSRLLLRWLKRQGYRVVFLRDPGSTALGRTLRHVLLHTAAPMSPLVEALLFIGGRVQLVEEKIAPALAKGRVVICDRFHDATVAYQGFGGELDVPWLNRFGRSAIGGVMPRLTILLDVPPAKGFARLRRAKDRIERKARTFHERVRTGYRKLAARERNRFVVLDASQPPEGIQRRIRQIVTRRLATPGGGRGSACEREARREGGFPEQAGRGRTRPNG
jgi:dTMP kinase